MAETTRFCPIRSAVCVTGFVLACLFAAKPAPAVEAATCRELERKFDLIKADIVSIQRNSALFAAADAGCEEFARRLLAAGASLAARDRLGAMPLAHAARAGQRALVELFLTKGAQIDGRNISGSTALYLAAENERQATVALLLAKGADPDLPDDREPRRSRQRLSRAMIVSSSNCFLTVPIRMSWMQPARWR